MPRPKNKTELLDLSHQNYEKLISFVDSFSEIEQKAEFPPGYLNRNIRDVFAHLYHWHLMLLNWYEVGMAGQKPDIPAKGYTWKTTSELNRVIQEKYETEKLEEVKKKLEQTHDKVRGLVREHSEEELFEKKQYKWTGSTSLGAYLISATSSHYDWAYKLIKKCKK